MRVIYELIDVFRIEEMCDFMSRIRKDGMVTNDYIINRDTNEMYFCSTDSCEKYKIIVDQHKLTLEGFSAEECVEYFNTAMDCFDKER